MFDEVLVDEEVVAAFGACWCFDPLVADALDGVLDEVFVVALVI